MMTRAIERFVLLIALVLLTNELAFAQAKPANVGRAVSGTIQSTLIKRGFAANDPRFGNTLARITPYLASSAGGAAAVAAAGVTAPAWVSVALAIGVGAVVTYGINLGLDALVNWAFRSDGTIDQSSTGNSGYSAAGFDAGGPAWTYMSSGVRRYGGEPDALARQYYYDALHQAGFPNPSSPSCHAATAFTYYCGSYSVSLVNTSPVGCPAGQLAIGLVCTSYTYPLPSAVPARTGLTPQQAIDGIPATDLNKQLNPALVAGLANRAWQQAASQPDYDGLPYPQSQPITSTEASTWVAQNPAYSPTVQDFVAPNPTTSADPQPWSLPSNPTAPVTSPATEPNVGTVNPAASEPLVNLGPDPGTGAPTLEATPTAQEILNPVLNMAPELRNFSVASNVGTCPRPTIELYGTHVLDAHCILIDEIKPVLQASMLFAWAAIALLIILSA